ncbi:hypothetical protein AXF42_Ash008022 [Apostasia shenzhenica]|uniref:Patatin n=1 Tax=Apostasia shenzhenica TaxID=1088818 RepID=A0A2I0A8A1_9ASPA|nr:hypothetical protein AXF42_Ash008022 [Apostasia shenzhenica]
MLWKPGGHPRRSLMAAVGALSSLLQNPRPLFSPNTISNPSIRFSTTRPRRFWCCVRGNGEMSTGPTPAPVAEAKRSLAVATGELFLGLASLLLRSRGSSSVTERAVAVPEDVMELVADRGEEAPRYAKGGERDASAVEEPVIWEQRIEDLEAERKRKKVTSPGFSFSAAGLLFPYHLGVAQLLLDKGYIQETTPLAGSSAGAIVCAVIASGNSMGDALHATKVLAEDCRVKGTAFRLGAVLRNVLNEFLPHDVHIKSNGRIRDKSRLSVILILLASFSWLILVAITQLSWRPRGLLVDQFDSKEDLINAVITSSFIPGYVAPRPATIFRNRLCIDGGLTLFMPPTSASNTVRVCAFPIKRLGLRGIGISPDCNPENRASPRQLFNWALEPADDDILDRLYELGYLDATVWAQLNPVESIVMEENCLRIDK